MEEEEAARILRREKEGPRKARKGLPFSLVRSVLRQARQGEEDAGAGEGTEGKGLRHPAGKLAKPVHASLAAV